MKRILASALICAAPLSILIAPPASAQWTVYDPANHIQNIYQAIRSLQEVNQQIQQLTHEIEMLENMARDLEALPDSIADDILRRMRRIEELSQVLRDPDSRAQLTLATQALLDGEHYKCLKALRVLLPREERLLAHRAS